MTHIFIEKVGFLDIASPVMMAIWVEEALKVEAVGGNLLCYRLRLSQKFPELRRRAGPAWKSATNAHNGDGFVLSMRWSECHVECGSAERRRGRECE